MKFLPRAKAKGQIGLEYMVLFGSILFAVLGIAYFFYGDFQVQNREFQARVAADKLVNAADAVASQGVGSTKRVIVFFPDGLANATAGGREVFLRVYAKGGLTSDVARVSIANITRVNLPIISSRYSFLVSFNTSGNVSIVLE